MAEQVSLYLIKHHNFEGLARSADRATHTQFYPL